MSPKLNQLIQWEYCECGCHGDTQSIAGVHFWQIFSNNIYILRIGHGFCGMPLGEFETINDANKEVLRSLNYEFKDDLLKLKLLCELLTNYKK